MLEILISIGVLSIGLLGVAALIPIGKLALVQTNISDRGGCCGRAGLREIKTRRMLDTSTQVDPFAARVGWALPSGLYGPYVIDPLGVANGLSAVPLGGNRTTGITLPPTGFGNYFPLPRLTLNWAYGAYAAQAEQVFRWHDDLTYVLPRDYKAAPQNGNRPMPSPNWNAQPDYDPSFSWFVTVSPTQSPRVCDVSVVACYKRIFAVDTSVSTQPMGEQAVDLLQGMAGFPGGGYGGGTILLAGSPPDADLNHPVNKLKNNQWVMLCGWVADGSGNNRLPVRCQWYRVVGVNRQRATPDSPVTMLSLVGPDWDVTAYPNVTLVVVDGVTGVYSSTVQLDSDGVWTK